MRTETESRYIYKEKLVTHPMLGTEEEGVRPRRFLALLLANDAAIAQGMDPREGGRLQGKYCPPPQKCTIHNMDALCFKHLDSDPWVFTDQCNKYIFNMELLSSNYKDQKDYRTLTYGKGSLWRLGPSGDRTVKSTTPRTNFLIQDFV